MKFVAISDTHNKHKDLVLPYSHTNPGDVLVHAGDVSGRGYSGEVEKFLKWFSQQPFRYKIFIAGNHDFFFEQKSEEEIKNMVPGNVIYLNDSGVTIEGIHIWGSPVQPWFNNWAFNRARGTEIRKHWDLVPAHTDVLLTHGPPFGVLDTTVYGSAVGCEELMDCVNRLKPRYHVFGHIHEAYGIHTTQHTTFINASILNENYAPVNRPVAFEINSR